MCYVLGELLRTLYISLLTVAIVAVELLYFERDVLEREIETLEEDLSDAL